MANPQEQGPQPPFPQQRQQWPGTESEMQPKPDFGESSYRGHERLKGKAAIITGGDSGIGRAVALAYAREGADVLISYLSEHSDAQKTVELVRESGRAAIAIAGDISHEDHCRQIINRAVEEFGKIDILVNNAAYQQTYESIESFLLTNGSTLSERISMPCIIYPRPRYRGYPRAARSLIRRLFKPTSRARSY
jgi:NAD(P)-dependent dehydrogenase (short-subunit alcohol dehydrogenase family)